MSIPIATSLLYNTSGGSNKFYEVCIKVNFGLRGRNVPLSFSVTRRWGRRASESSGGGQTLSDTYASLTRAVSAANRTLTSKVEGGYRAYDRRLATFNLSRTRNSLERAREAQQFTTDRAVPTDRAETLTDRIMRHQLIESALTEVVGTRLPRKKKTAKKKSAPRKKVAKKRYTARKRVRNLIRLEDIDYEA